MSNKEDLVKVAVARLASAGTGLTNVARSAKAGTKSVFSQIPIHNKIGLGLGVTSLGVSVAGYRNGAANREAQETHKELEAKSLSALQKIHKALVASTNKNVTGSV